MTPGVTIAICCHNSQERILETLRHLIDQKVPNELSWEVLLIDNASTDDTDFVASTFWDQHGNVPLRIIREETPGLSHARERAFREATHEIISFIDDDNWVTPDWVCLVSNFFSMHPDVGAVGGRGYEVSDGYFPPWFALIRRAYACGEQYDREMDVTDLETSLLWGAGLSVRTEINQDIRKKSYTFLCLDRVGRHLSSSGDVELCHVIRLLGWRLCYSPSMEFKHFIPKERLTWKYARGLYRGSGKGSVFIKILRSATRKSRRYHLLECYWWFQIIRIIKHGIRFLLLHPTAVFRTTEGNIPGLMLDSLLAQLSQIVAIRKRYRALYEECRIRFRGHCPP